jgi:aminoglycoside phosphotransferase (APT) family kinase protein
MRIGGLSLRTTSSPAEVILAPRPPSGRDGWTEGPYGEPARQLVGRHAARLDNRFARYDNLAGAAAGQSERMVLTHGEPHAANTINTDGGMVLIDWDTALVAPRERDL